MDLERVMMPKTGVAVALAAVLAGCVQTKDELPSGKNPDPVAQNAARQGEKTGNLDAAWRAKNFGKPTLPASFKRVAFDHRKVKVVDRAPGEKVALTPMRIRGNAKYFFYAPKAGEVRFTGRFVKIGATPIGKEIVVTGKHYNKASSA